MKLSDKRKIKLIKLWAEMVKEELETKPKQLTTGEVAEILKDKLKSNSLIKPDSANRPAN